MKKLLKALWHFPRQCMVFLIWVWQHTFSLDHGPLSRFFGPYCRFTPTCSEYGKQAFRKYGFWKGLAKTVWRVLRCNPLSKGGKDLP